MFIEEKRRCRLIAGNNFPSLSFSVLNTSEQRQPPPNRFFTSQPLLLTYLGQPECSARRSRHVQVQRQGLLKKIEPFTSPTFFLLFAATKNCFFLGAFGVCHRYPFSCAASPIFYGRIELLSTTNKPNKYVKQNKQNKQNK